MIAGSNAVYANKSQQVAQMLLDRLIKEDLEPGNSIGTEAELLEQYNVSRPTLRESLRILESQGVLSLRPGPKGGIIVKKPSINVLARSLSVYLRLNHVPLIEILRARIAIEPALVAGAAVHGTEDDFEAMDRSNDRLENGIDGSDEELRAENREFHNLIARASCNPVLETYWLTICSLASGEGENFKFTQNNRRAIAQDHRAIVNACRQRDPVAAQALMNKHLSQLEILLHKLGKRE